MTLSTLLYAALAAFLLGIGTGMFTEFKLNEAAKLVQATKDLKAAQTGEVNLVKNGQKARKVLRDTTDKCASTTHSADIGKLLRNPYPMP